MCCCLALLCSYITLHVTIPAKQLTYAPMLRHTDFIGPNNTLGNRHYENQQLHSNIQAN